MSRNKRLTTVKVSGKAWDVLDRVTGNKYATLYLQSRGDGFRFRLENYPHRMSNMYGLDQALSAIEKEVF